MLRNFIAGSRNTRLTCLPLILLAILVGLLPIPGTTAARYALLTLLLLLILYRLLTRQQAWLLPRQWPYLAVWALACLYGVLSAAQPAYAWSEFKTEVIYGIVAFWLGAQLASVPRAGYAMSVGIVANWLSGLLISGLVVWTGIGWEQLEFTKGIGRTASLVSYWVVTMPLLFLTLAQRLVEGRSLSPQQAYIGWGIISMVAIWITLISNQRIGLPIVFGFGVLGGLWLHRTMLGRPLPRHSMLYGVLLGLALVAISFYLQIKFRFKNAETAWFYLVNDPRLVFWHDLLQQLVQTPWQGHGFGRETLKQVFPQLLHQDNLLWHPHNLVMSYFLYAGVFGLVALLGLFIVLPYQCYRQAQRALQEQTKLAATAWGVGICLLLGALLRNQVNDMWVRDNALLFWLLLGYVLGYAQIIRNRPSSNEVIATQ
ncbi:O-antigen ligase family protein [Parvibium lacunae]|uniref:O-antigen ligase domain-containing protein n=1 Tax=Parvibium lacunae TaxID=1888893 RepID=A0A368L410_9BURK|nr:O-antigen ligase family protein [Parvibium lacunae]RCS58309.1 O-antigen ligase domain-containing protein [Parvibium lacunae]